MVTGFLCLFSNSLFGQNFN